MLVGALGEEREAVRGVGRHGERRTLRRGDRVRFLRELWDALARRDVRTPSDQAEELYSARGLPCHDFLCGGRREVRMGSRRSSAQDWRADLLTGQWSILGQCGDFGRGKRTSSQWVFVLWQISNTRGSQLLLPSLDHIIGSYFFLKETYGGGGVLDLLGFSPGSSGPPGALRGAGAFCLGGLVA